MAGRLNDIIKTGGANVSPPEIDAVLADYPGVKIAATVGVPHDTLGEMVVACIVPEAGVSLDEDSGADFRREAPFELQGAAASAVHAGIAI